MNTIDHAQRLADLLVSNGLDTVVHLELSANPDVSLVVWPYAVDANPALRNERSPPRSHDGGVVQAMPHQRTHVLVVPATLAAYDQARRIVLDNPIQNTPDASIKIAISDLPMEDMLALFQAAQVPYRLALALEIDETT